MGSAARVTSAAEGLPRRRFTVAEVEAMVAAGVMEEDERVELIGGELVPMSPKGNHHEVVKAALLQRWYRASPDEFGSGPRDYLPPERRHVSRTRRRHLSASERPPGTDERDNVLLVVEIAELVAALRRRPQGGALRQFRHPRALGHRRGSADDPSFPRAGGGRLSQRAGLRPRRAARRQSIAPEAFALRLDRMS